MKLKLNLDKRDACILSKKELKSLLGGADYTTGTCCAYLPKGSDMFGGITGTGSFAADQLTANEGVYVWKRISKEFALAVTNGVSGAKWCCDSCASSTWCH